MKARRRFAGYHQLPSTFQSPTAARPVDRSEWLPCDQCGRETPGEINLVIREDGTFERLPTGTYVCAHCRHSHVGTPSNREEATSQTTCHECGVALGDAYQCPACGFPRGWKTVACPYCGNQQAVLMPHWVFKCDAFTLDCVRCEARFVSLCIC